MDVLDTIRLTLGIYVGIKVLFHSSRLLKARATKLGEQSHKGNLPPGPYQWPIFGTILDLGANPSKALGKMCSEYYGGIMTVYAGSTSMVVISSPNIMAEFMAPFTTADHFESHPGELMQGGATNFITAGYCQYIKAPKHRCPQWRKLNRILSRYLVSNNASNMSSYQRVSPSSRHQVLATLIQNLKKEANVRNCYAVNMRPHIRYGCLSLLYAICFGSLVDPNTGQKDHQLIKLLSTYKDMVRLGTTCNFSDYVPIISGNKSRPKDKRFARCARLAEACCVEMVRIVRQKFTPKDPKRSKLWRSFLDMLTNLKGEELLTDREITWILSEIMLSAMDHMATTIEWVLGHLICRPDIQKLVKDEIDEVVGASRPVGQDDIDKLHYLKAVVKETQRLNHPVMLTLPHVLSKKFKAGVYNLPAGTHIVAVVAALFTDPNLWIEPHDFRPERFIHEFRGWADAHGGSDNPVKHKLQVDVFNAVRRFSPGYMMVTHKSQLFIATLLQSFDILAAFTGMPCPYDETSSFESGVINMIKTPLQASLRPRHK